MGTQANTPTPGAAGRLHGRAFTLVELLVVIGVIGLLVGILVPSLMGAKTLARRARVTAVIKALDSGLEMFRNDQSLGEDYPPSFWDTSAGGNPYDPAYGQTGGEPTTGYKAYGSQVLLWGLAGADYLGTPGFGGQLNKLYELVSGKPKVTRQGPFIDATKVNAKKPTKDVTIFITVANLASDKVPCIFDDFDRPILYYRADTTKQGMGKYDPNDNLPFCRSGVDPIADTATKTFGDSRDFNGFDGFIHNPKVTSTAQPMNEDSYLLISAGPDGLYGTRDDITNFPVTGENLPQPP